MTASIADVRDGLVEVLTNGLSPDVNVYRLPADNVDVPAVIVAGITGRPETFDAAGRTLTVDLYVVVSHRNLDEVDVLDRLVDESQADSVPAVIHADMTLGDRDASAKVTGFGEYREMEIGGIGFYAATVNVEVLV